jgi:hypothetical protein
MWIRTQSKRTLVDVIAVSVPNIHMRNEHEVIGWIATSPTKELVLGTYSSQARALAVLQKIEDAICMSKTLVVGPSNGAAYSYNNPELVVYTMPEDKHVEELKK